MRLLLIPFLLMTMAICGMDSGIHTTNLYRTLLVIRYAKKFEQHTKTTDWQKISSTPVTQEMLKRYRERVIEYCVSYQQRKGNRIVQIGNELVRAANCVPSNEQELHYIINGGTPPLVQVDVLLCVDRK